MTWFSWSGVIVLPALPDPQQRLYFLPLPHGQGAFLDGAVCIEWALNDQER
jgi:hypothetical protein